MGEDRKHAINFLVDEGIEKRGELRDLLVFLFAKCSTEKHKRTGSCRRRRCWLCNQTYQKNLRFKMIKNEREPRTMERFFGLGYEEQCLNIKPKTRVAHVKVNSHIWPRWKAHIDLQFLEPSGLGIQIHFCPCAHGDEIYAAVEDHGSSTVQKVDI